MLTEAGNKDALTVLVVDDEPDFLFKTVELLKEDFRVLATDEVDVALHLLESREIAIVLSDTRRARSRGGRLLRRATGLSASTVRLLLTGGGDVDFLQATQANRAFLYLSRHWNARRLAECVREALALRDRILTELSPAPREPAETTTPAPPAPAPVTDLKAPDRPDSDFLPEILAEYRRVLSALKESEARCRELEAEVAAAKARPDRLPRVPGEVAEEPVADGPRVAPTGREAGRDGMSRRIRGPLERLRISSERLLSADLDARERTLAKEIRKATVDLFGRLDRWLGPSDQRSESDHADLSAFDPKFLDNFRRMEEARGDAVFVPMARTFLGKAPVYLEMIRRALAEGHLVPLARAAHSLTGVAGTLGALRLSDASRELERRARGGVVDGCDDQLEVVVSEYEIAESQIHELVAGDGPES